MPLVESDSDCLVDDSDETESLLLIPKATRSSLVDSSSLCPLVGPLLLSLLLMIATALLLVDNLTPLSSLIAMSSCATDTRIEVGYNLIVLIGDANIVGVNAVASQYPLITQSGHHIDALYDYTDARIQQLGQNTQPSTGISYDGRAVLARDPLEHIGALTSGLYASVGSAMTFAKQYVRYTPPHRIPILVPCGRSRSSIGSGEWTPPDGMDFVHCAKRIQTFLNTNKHTPSHIAVFIASFGLAEAAAITVPPSMSLLRQ